MILANDAAVPESRPRKGVFWRTEFERILVRAAAMLQRMEDHRRHRKDIALLMTMSDRDLRDIGLSRTDVLALEHGIGPKNGPAPANTVPEGRAP